MRMQTLFACSQNEVLYSIKKFSLINMWYVHKQKKIKTVLRFFSEVKNENTGKNILQKDVHLKRTPSNKTRNH